MHFNPPARVIVCGYSRLIGSTECVIAVPINERESAKQCTLNPAILDAGEYRLSRGHTASIAEVVTV